MAVPSDRDLIEKLGRQAVQDGFSHAFVDYSMDSVISFYAGKIKATTAWYLQYIREQAIAESARGH